MTQREADERELNRLRVISADLEQCPDRATQYHKESTDALRRIKSGVRSFRAKIRDLEGDLR